jgi:predicted DsbA family dithiol-disulfide isomerase
MTGAIQLDVISDTICPWCFIGKRRLERALALRPEARVEIRWRPFQLDATIPVGGIDRQTYLERKFGGPDNARAVYARIEEAGAQEGIPFAFDRIRTTPNTIDSHRLIGWATSYGVQDAVVERLFTEFFTAGGDIGNIAKLTEIARACGMNAEQTEELLQGPTDIDRVQQEIGIAQQIGVTGVPCFVFANRFAVMGAQSAEILVDALDRAASEPAATGTGG